MHLDRFYELTVLWSVVALVINSLVYAFVQRDFSVRLCGEFVQT